MKCKHCGQQNPPEKKTCSSCGAFNVGRAINNVTGEIGYRNEKGNFIPDIPKRVFSYEKWKEETRLIEEENQSRIINRS